MQNEIRDIEMTMTARRLKELVAESQRAGKAVPQSALHACNHPTTPAGMANIILGAFYSVER